MTKEREREMEHVFDAAFWDRMYRHRDAAWDGEPNGFLAQETTDRLPGTALDLGCGEGADAVWLANRGWRVTAVDLSNVALDRGRAADTAQAVSWLQADMLVWQPPAEAYDLVSLHYVHVPPAERAALFGRLARAVRPGGTVLVVAHHPSDLETTVGRPPIPDLYFTSEEVAALLIPGRWEILVDGRRPQSVTDREGRPLIIHDMVLKARRLD
ncbi:Cypemycin methyltransferase [compost metagenome]